MRAFERTVDGQTRTWTVDLKGCELHITSGAPGREKTRVRTLRTPDAAVSALEAAIATMVEAGWEEQVALLPVGEVGALDWMATRPTDPAPYLVYGDHISEEDPVRAALIAVQGAMTTGQRTPELEAEEARLMSEPAAVFLGPLDPSEVSWFCGFIATLDFEPTAHPAKLAETLEAVVRAGQVPLLQQLTVQAPNLNPFPYVFARHRWPALRRLALHSENTGLSTPAQGLIATMPGLQSLSLQGELTGLNFVHPTLTHLALNAHEAHFPGLVRCELPALTHLNLGSPESPDGALLRKWVNRPLTRLQLSGGLPEVYVEGLKRRGSRPSELVLRAPSHPTRLARLLLDRASLLKRVSIRLEETDLLDAEIEDLERVLSIEVALPEHAVIARGSQLSEDQGQERRLEKVRKGTPRFWTIHREGSVVVLRWGVQGSDGQTQRKAFPTAEKAAADYRKRLRRKLAEGWHAA